LQNALGIDLIHPVEGYESISKEILELVRLYQAALGKVSTIREEY
jgi:hypothetical protein